MTLFIGINIMTIISKEELEQCRGLWQDLRTQQDCMADDSKCEELRKYHARQELFPYGRLNNEAEMRLLHKVSCFSNSCTW